MTAEWLSDDDGLVPLAIVGEAGEISYREGGENATQDSASLRGNLRGCAGTGSPTIHWCHRLAKRTPPHAAQACAVCHLRQWGDKTCERRTKRHIHIRLIQKKFAI